MRRPIAYFACMATISIISVFSILSSTTIIFVNASSTITKKELEAVHTNIHSHCRNIETQEYNTLREYACVNTPNMEWFDREEEEYVEDFENAVKHRKRRLVSEQDEIASTTTSENNINNNPWHGKALHVARFTADTIFSHENIDNWQNILNNEIHLDEIFRQTSYDGLAPNPNGKKNSYIRFYSNDNIATEVKEKIPNVEAVTVLPDSWKISPTFHGNGHLKTAALRDDNDEDDVGEETAGDIVTILIRIVHPTQASRKVGFKQRDISNMLNRWEQIIQENGITFTALRSATLDRHDPNEDLMVLEGVPDMQIKKAKFLIASFNEVKWIEPEMIHYVSNKFSRYVTQSYTEPGQNGKTTVWDHGLHGEDQVVGIGDSGLDVGSCFFNDPANTYGTITKGLAVEKPNHRKVTQYVPFADGGPGNGNPGENLDHGTHVAGSVAGKSRQNGGGIYDGMAYEAKIAFFDIGQTGARGLSVPQSLERNFFPFAYKAGAKIHTNSWGSNSDAYTATARSVDAFTFQNQDFTVLVAAGNSGGQGGRSTPGTIGSPASSKNCIAVGASQSTSQSFTEANAQCDTLGPSQSCQDNMARFSSVGVIRSDGRLKPDIAAPGHRTWSALSTPGQGGTVCQPGGGDPRTTVAAISGTSMATPTTAGNVALIRQYFTEGFYPFGIKSASNAFEPMGALLKATIVNSGKFMGGRHGSNTPPVLLCQGADPTTKICGKNIPDTTNPNSPNSMRASPTYVERSIQGHGLTVLDRTLSFADDVEADKTDLLAIGNMADMKSLKTGEEHTYEINTVSTNPPTPLRITLAWNDAPGPAGAAKALTNDLDLVVTDADGKTYIPNGLQTLPVDDINPLEQVEVNAPGAQKIIVKVKGTSVTTPFVSTNGQPYALVVSGRFRKTGDLIGGVNGGAPTIIKTNIPYVDGRKNKLFILGSNDASITNEARRSRRSLLQTSTQDVEVIFECSDGTPPVGAVESVAIDSITVNTNEGWTCPTTMSCRKVVNGVESETVEIGKISTGGFVTNADGTVTATPTEEDANVVCQTFTLERTCKSASFCDWDSGSQTCSAKSYGWIVFLVLLIIACVVIGCFFSYKKYQKERDRPRGNIHYSERDAQNVEIRYMEKGDKNGAATQQIKVSVPGPPLKRGASKGGNMSELAPGWQAIKDDESGDYYYYNSASGDTTWDMPKRRKSLAKTPNRDAKTPRGFRGKSADFDIDGAKQNLPGDWEAIVEDESGDTFYYNPKTGETQWDKPVRRDDDGQKSVPARSAKTPRGFRANSGFTADDGIPEPWEAVVEVESGDTYYYNKKTQEVTWDLPQ